MSVIGIDLGNENVYIAQAKRGGIDLVLNENTNRKNPSLVSFQGKERFAGESAATLAKSNFKNTVKWLKRLIGRQYDAPEIQADLVNLHFKTFKQEDGRVGIEVKYNDEPFQMSCEQALAVMLTKVKSIVEDANPAGFKASDMVISVPGYFTDVERRAMLDAVEISGMNCLCLMNEHTATALSYGIYKNNRGEFDAKEPQHYMFLDLGQSCYTACVCTFVQGKLQIKSVRFDRQLGGRDFDKKIAEHYAAIHKEKTGDDVMSNPKAYIKMMAGAEKSKKDISPKGVSNSTCNVECIMNDKDFVGRMSLEEFEAMCAPLIERLEAPITQALEDAGITAADLSGTEIVGGASRIQMVKQTWSKVLGLDAEAVNYGLSTTLNADESIARGCALQCAMLSPLFRVKEFAISDVVPYSVTLSWEQTDVAAPAAADDDAEDGEDGGAAATGDTSSVMILQRGDDTPKTRRVTFRRTEPFEVTASYAPEASEFLPPSTSLDIGKFMIDVPKIDLQTPDLPRISVFVKHDQHGVFGVSSVVLKHEIIPEPAETPAEAAPAPAAPADEAPTEDKAPTEEPAAAAGDDADSTAAAAGDDAAPADDKKEGGAEAGEAGDAAEEKPVEEVKPKKKYRKVDVAVNETVSRMSSKQMDGARAAEQAMIAQDRDLRETADKRNELEAFIYSMRDRITGDLKDFADDATKESFTTALQEAEDWLYSDEGFDSTKALYTEKLGGLQKFGNTLLYRRQEQTDRPQAISDLVFAIEEYKSLAESTEERYKHISVEERDIVRSEVGIADKWLKEKSAVQGEKAAHEDPVMTTEDVKAKSLTLRRVCRPIQNKPKPLPPKEDKPVEAKPAPKAAPDAEASEGKDGEGKEGEAAGEKATEDMDLD